MPYTYEYPRPAVTVDIIPFILTKEGLRVLLIRRKNPPFQGCWALPGGFLDMDEELADAAVRELKEETGVAPSAMRQLSTYGKIGRDPRGRTISVAFVAAISPKSEPRAASDAASLAWYDPKNTPDMAFDHDEILRDAVGWLLSNLDGGEFASALLGDNPSSEKLAEIRRPFSE